MILKTSAAGVGPAVLAVFGSWMIASAAVHAADGSRTRMTISAIVAPSCRIETAATSAGPWVVFRCGSLQGKRSRLLVDGRPAAPARVETLDSGAMRVHLTSGDPVDVVQLDF